MIAEAKQNDAPNAIFAPREIIVWSDQGSRQVIQYFQIGFPKTTASPKKW